MADKWVQGHMMVEHLAFKWEANVRQSQMMVKQNGFKWETGGRSDRYNHDGTRAVSRKKLRALFC